MRKITFTFALFAAVLLTSYTAAAQDEKQDKKLDPEKLFEKLDANKDGKISKEEFEKVGERLGTLGKGKLEGKGAQITARLFDRLDENKDGNLSKKEFEKFSELRGKGDFKEKLKDKLKGKLGKKGEEDKKEEKKDK